MDRGRFRRRLEKMLAGDPPRASFAMATTPTMADVLLVPQMFSARRFGVDLAA